MTTQAILTDIKRTLGQGKHVPSGDVRALLAICEALTAVIARQQAEIQTLKQAALPAPETQPEVTS